MEVDLRLILRGESRALETGATDSAVNAISSNATMAFTRILHLFEVGLASTILHYKLHFMHGCIHLRATRHVGLGIVRTGGS